MNDVHDNLTSFGEELYKSGDNLTSFRKELYKLGDNLTSFREELYKSEELLNAGTILFLHKILVYGVTPVICAFGIVGNILSILILKRHGLHKCSNILLVSLAFSDCCFLVSFNNVPKALYDIHGNGRFLYSREVSHFLYAVYYLFTVFDYGMAFVGLTIPALITVERVIAVFWPLHFSSIVTPSRTWSVVVFFGAYGMGFMIYSCFWNQFEYKFDPVYNDTVGRIVNSALFYKDQEFRSLMDQIHIGVKIQPMVAFIGCILIIIKVKMASNKRKKLSGSTHHRSSVSKTTKTLMAVCVVYILVCSVLALPVVLPESVLHFSLTSSVETTNLALVTYQVLNIILCMNSSWNFIIYIVFNKNFRDTYREIAGKHCCSSRKR